jgi:hypothetical protein
MSFLTAFFSLAFPFLGFGLVAILFFMFGARWYRAKLQQTYGNHFLSSLEARKLEPLL